MQREELEVDVLLVGAGPACLSSAFHLARLVEDHNLAVESGGKSGSRLDPTLLVVEKGKEIGSHALSGAVVEPSAIAELVGDCEGEDPPYDSKVSEDGLYYLSARKSYRFPMTPPPLKNHGYYVASLGVLVRWLADLCERKGVEVYPGFPGVELLFEDKRVIGVRMGDRGRDREGNPKANFEPGIDVRAKITILGEGPRGTLTRQAEKRLKLGQGRQPQVYALGVKELWRVPRELKPGAVFHTLGFPLGTEEFGGGFIYTMQDNLIDVGLVVGLDYRNPFTDPHRLLQELKTHPFVRAFFEEGELVSYGAKAIPEGGYYAMPRPFADGLMIVGDSGGFLNAQRLKGIHLAVKSGILAAETAFEALLQGDLSANFLGSYSTRFEASLAREELWKARNFRQAFQSGFGKGLLHTASQFLTGGRGLQDPFPIEAGHQRMRKLRKDQRKPVALVFDGNLTFDKLSDLYCSDTNHEENQPSHLKILDTNICDTRCKQEYGNPCQYFCPANVYEILHDAVENRLRVNFSNCVHCKTCEIVDPYQIIVWTPPEGGGGPDWKQM